jgi:hypothetical protein
MPLGARRRVSIMLLTLLYNGRIEVCLGPPVRPMGPKAPRWGESPRPWFHVRTQMGPEPALGLAIRPAAFGPGLRARRSGEGWAGAGIVPLAGVRAASQAT